ncbi:MAG TPA: TetR/AcrR family transcriptional regulator [Caulobacteraceae bacterium]|nr:TetR/AcrR family transcriptional regulator [Caulobacteraceae bacterium]
MPRAPGQIDRVKNEAILQAAGDVLAERGLSAPMSMIARRAKVSKQTIYNHYGAKTDLIRALASRRVTTLTAPLEPAVDGGAEDKLALYARALLGMVTAPATFALMRLTVQSANELPELAREVYEVGPKTSRERLAAFLASENAAGRLNIPNALEAAEIFIGMVSGQRQTRALLGLPAEEVGEQLDRLSREIAHRFVRAYRG